MFIFIYSLCTIIIISGIMLLNINKNKWTMEDYIILEKLKKKLKIIIHYSGYKLNIDNLTFNLNNQTFTEDKKHINMCIKDKKNNKYYDENMLIFAFLHEIAHVICNDYKDHSSKFIIIFRNLISTSERLGYYNRNIKKPEYYCGIKNVL